MARAGIQALKARRGLWCQKHEIKTNSKGVCRACSRLEWYAENRDKRKLATAAYRRRLKQAVIDAYGGACNCCGERTFEFLALDHKDGRPPGERKTGDAMYRQARDEGFPPKYRVLCSNCNSARGYYGYCPHERKLPVSQTV